MPKRQLKLGAFMRPVSIHTGAWRYPGAWPDANFNFAHIRQLIRKLEAGKFDAFFMADHLAVLNMPINALKRSHTVTSFEPFTLLSALAGLTEHIGLIATGSTTFDEPYHVARRFASLDHISGGRAGWNIVTTSNPDAALNFGLEDHMEHAERYKRAREFYDVVTGLWDSFADDAFVRDVESGLYFDPGKMHVLNHKGTSPARCKAGRSSCRPALPRTAGSSRPKPRRPCSPAAVRWPTHKSFMPTSRAAWTSLAATAST
jgi:alkanesulfonate monooxygenase